MDSEVSVYEVKREEQYIVRYYSNLAEPEEFILLDINHLEHESLNGMAWESYDPYYVSNFYIQSDCVDVYQVAKKVLLEFPAPDSGESYTFEGYIFFCFHNSHKCVEFELPA